MLSILLPILPISSLIAWAEGVGGTADAMEEIEGDDRLSRSKQGETRRFDDDGYIGIPYEVTVYYDDETHGTARSGYSLLGATPVILYVVNADFERIGTDSDVSIITSMLDRGYAVIVLDYLNDARAKSPDLEWSTMPLWMKAEAGEFFTGLSAFEEGKYIDTLTVPSGYNVLLNDVFFEQDKHGVDGTLEEIVKVWNNDFRGIRGTYVVKWVHADGTRKATQNGFDGSAPVWYSDAAGTVEDQENGQYIMVKHTKAETITDCVKPDGSPLDLDLHSHFVYPTNPEKKVPVMVLFSSGNSLCECFRKEDRPHFTGFLFDGYAGMLAEYAYVPMELTYSLYGGEFSGTNPGGVTNENMIYATYTYNATQSATAALRRARYLALSEPETYCFDIDHFGSYGLSRNAWHTQLGAPVLRNDLLTAEEGYTEEEIAQHVNDKVNSFVQLMLPEQCSGRTRYDNGKTETYTVDGVTIDGGELQPWAVWDGKEISSGLQANHSSCGGFLDYFCEGYAPQFISVNLSDNYTTQYGKQNDMINLSRTMNIATLWFETDIPHSFAYGIDRNYGVDVYEAYFDFMGYYLKGDAVKVAYTDPVNGSVIGTTDGITVKFIGDVTADEIQKVTVKDGEGNVLVGTWTSAYGNTEWTFLADSMKGNTAYTLTVPADLAGSNGVAMGKAYTASFHTRPEGDVAVVGNAATVDENGTNVTLTVPTTVADGYALRVLVNNDAANTLLAYDASTDALVGSVRVSGAGYYEIDVTDLLAEYAAGDEVTLRLVTANADGNAAHWEQTFDTDNGGLSFLYSALTVGAEIDGAKALKIVRTPRVGKAEHVVYHNMSYDAFTTNKLIKNGAAVTREDLGRTFLITLRVYDTVSRPVRFYMNHQTAKATEQFDYDRCYYTGMTAANEWTEFKFPYTVYEMKYGCTSQVKELTVQLTPLGGCDEPPIYLDNLKVEEVFTDLGVASVSLVSEKNSGNPVKAPASENAFKVGATEYATWKAAMNAAADGATVTMQSNYTLTDSDVVNLAGKTSLTVDLNGYRLTAGNTGNAPLWISATNTTEVSLTLKNGSVILGDTPLVGYGSSTAAGNGKVINVSVESVYLTVAEGSASHSIVSEGSVTSGVKVTSNITFTDSTIDVLRERFLDQTLNDVVVLHSGTQGLSVHYAFVGGSIVMNSIKNTVLCESVVTVSENSDGDEFRVLVPVSVSAPMASFKLGEGYGTLQSVGAENGYAVYEVLDAELSTPYGAVAKEFADATAYPFAIFMDEAFITGVKTWGDALTAVREALNHRPGATVNVLLRADHKNDSWAASAGLLNGTVVLDLGGHTLLRGNKSGLIEANNTGVDATLGAVPTNVIIKNGKLYVGRQDSAAGQIVTVQATDSGSYDKTFNITFEDVTFAVSKTSCYAGLNRVIAFSSTGAGSDVITANITLRNSIFRFVEGEETAVPASAILFSGYNNKNKISITLEGGYWEGSANGITLSDLDSTLCPVTFKKNSDGAYFEYRNITAGTPPTAGYPTDSGKIMYFTKQADNVYTLMENPLITDYGTIANYFKDPAKFPFALFDENRTFFNGGTTWGDAQTKAKDHLANNPGKTVYILLRGDHNNDSWSPAAGVFHGTIVLDLGGHTLIRGNKSGLIEANNTGVDATLSAAPTNIIIKNGTLYAGKQGSAAGHIVTLEATASGTYDKTFNITFDGVTFAVSKANCTAGLNAVVAYSSTGAGTDVLTANITLRNSIFRFVDSDDTMIPTSSSLFSGYNSKNNVSIVFEGGKWEGSANGVSLAALGTLRFDKNSDGEYFKFEVTSGEPAWTAYNTDLGNNYYFVMQSPTVYALAKDPLHTEYGTISNYFRHFYKFPFALFDENGTFFNGGTNWGDAQTKANTYLTSNPGKTVYILLRTDHNNDSWSPAAGVFHGTIVLDLGGHKLTRGNKSGLIEANNTGVDAALSAIATGFIIKNGTLYVGQKGSAAGHIVTIQATDAGTYDKTFNITFEDVTFAVSRVNNNAGLNRVIAFSSTGTGSDVITANVTLRNSTFRFVDGDETVVPTSASIFDGFNSKNKISIVIEGGSWEGSASGIYFLTGLDKALCPITFRRNSDGEYFKYDITAGAPLSGAVNTDRGVGYFVPGNAEGEYILGIGRAQVTGASVNLGTDLSMLYYVRLNDPALRNTTALSMRFAVGGARVTVSEYTVINGEYVFLLSGIAPQQIGDLIDAEVMIADETVASHNGYSIKQNCLNLLSRSAAQLGLSEAKYAALRTLIADLLAYGQAALEYTEYPARTPILDGGETLDFSALTPSDADKPVLTGNGDPTLRIKSATVRFDTVNKLRIRIYAENTEGVTVSVNGTVYTLDELTSLGGGVYMLTTDAISATGFGTVCRIVLSFGGVETATLEYSVNAYAYSMYTSESASAAMKSLALALYRYGTSAVAYANAK